MSTQARAPARGLRATLALEEATSEHPEDYRRQHAERLRRSIALMLHHVRWKTNRVLEVGAGPLSPDVARALPNRSFHVLDPGDTWRGAVESTGGAYHRGSLLDRPLPLASRAFDAVLALEVFEHLTECPQHIVPEITRILAPEGILVVTTPNQARWLNRVRMALGVNIQERPEQLFHKGWMSYGHIHEFTLPEFGEEFAVGGMEVEVVGSWSPHPMPRGDRVRRLVDRFGPKSMNQILYGVFRRAPENSGSSAADVGEGGS